MGQVNVNTPGPRDDGAAAAGFGTGMMLMLLIGLTLLLLLAWFVLRPMLFGSSTDVNVNVRSSDVAGLLHLLV